MLILSTNAKKELEKHVKKKLSLLIIRNSDLHMNTRHYGNICRNVGTNFF